MLVVVYLSLLFVLFSSDITDASENPKFGCNFNDDYELQNPPEQTGNHLIAPVWSDQPIETVSFKDEAEFEEFLAALNKVQKEVLEKYGYNTLDNLLAFYDAYNKKATESQKAKSGMDFNKFFEDYQEATKPQDGAFFTIELTKQMISLNSKFAKNMQLSYLSTCSLAIRDKSSAENIYLSNDISHLQLNNFHNHVMGFMNIQVGEDSGNTGVVVMDPGMGLDTIIVLMDQHKVEDEYNVLQKHVSRGTTLYPESKQLFYSRNGSYIIVHPASNIKKVEQLCYIGKSYCSFQDTTRKPMLTAASHSNLSTYTGGKLKAGLFFNLFDQGDHKAGLEIWVPNQMKYMNSDQANVLLSTYIYKKEKVTTHVIEDYNILSAYEKLCSYTKYDVGKLLKIFIPIWNDEAFKSQMQALHKKFAD